MSFVYVGRRAQNNSGQAAPTDPGADQLAGVGSPLLVRTGSVPHRSHRDRGGHQRSPGVTKTAVHRHCTPNTGAAGVARQRVRIPPDGCRGPAALANEAGVTEDRPYPAAEVVPSPPGPSHVRSHRPCPGRALSLGQQRSFTDNKGRCVFPPSCRTAPYGAARGSFPSSCRRRVKTDPLATAES